MVTTARYGGSSCSELSRAAGETLSATASVGRVWFLLEHPGPWGRDALRDAVLPDRVREHLERALAAVPRSRLLLVRRGARSSGPISLFVAVADERRPVLSRLRLASWDDLLALDLPALAAVEAPVGAPAGPLLLVCVHGSHDRCCARHGLPLYRLLQALPGAEVWQSSHLGGDRFAPNLAWFPEGVFYGRLATADLPDLVRRCRDGRLSLPHYRGRSCYPFDVQAAESFVRRETGIDRVHGLAFARRRRLSHDRVRVTFQALSPPALHVAEVERHPSAFTLRPTCRAASVRAVPQYRLLALETRGTAGTGGERPR